MRSFRLIESQGTLPLPIHHRRIVSLCLLHLIFRLPRQSLRRKHVLNPILDRNLDGISFPIRLILRDFPLLPAVPVDRGADQLIGADRLLDLALSIRQFRQWFHHVGLEPGSLQRVIDPPEPPHTRHVVLRDMAMEHKFAGQRLQPAGSTFDHFIIDLGRSDGLHIQTIRGVVDQRKLDRTILRQRRIQLAGSRLSGPTNRPTMQVVGMDDF